MANQVYPDDALEELALRMVAGGIQCTMSAANITYDQNVTLSDLVSGGVSSSTAVPAADFVLSGVSGGSGFAIAAPINIISNGNTYYSVFVTNNAATKLLWFVAIPGGITLANGAPYSFLPIVGDASKFLS